jgi:hypothetical protein
MDSTQLKELGFPYPHNVLLLIEGGSRLHGATLAGTDATDWYGLYVEPAEIDAAELIRIRSGEYELSELVAWANQLQPEAGEAKGHSPLPGKTSPA